MDSVEKDSIGGFGEKTNRDLILRESFAKVKGVELVFRLVFQQQPQNFRQIIHIYARSVNDSGNLINTYKTFRQHQHQHQQQ